MTDHTPNAAPAATPPCCHAMHGPTQLYRTYNAGRGLQPEVCGLCIEAKAQAAVQAGQSLLDACPYPFFTQAGQFFKSSFYKASASKPTHTTTPTTTSEAQPS